MNEKYAVQCRFDGRPLNSLIVRQPLHMKAVIGKSDAHILVHDYASCPRSAIIHSTAFHVPTSASLDACRRLGRVRVGACLAYAQLTEANGIPI